MEQKLETPVTYEVLFDTDPENTGSILFNGTTYIDGAKTNVAKGNYEVSAVAPSGYIFSNWSPTGYVTVADASSISTTATISGAGTVRAVFISTAGPFMVAIDTVPQNTGSVLIGGYERTDGQQILIAGGTQTLVARPANGYLFTGWEDSPPVVVITDKTSPNTTCQIAGDEGFVRMKQVLDDGQCRTITFRTTPSNIGSIEFNNTIYTDGMVKTDCILGETYSIKANVAPGYVFMGWLDDGGLSIEDSESISTTCYVSGSGTINMWTESLRTVEFHVNPKDAGYIVFDGVAYTDGQSVSGIVPASSHSISVVPGEGYHFESWLSEDEAIYIQNELSEVTTAIVVSSGILTVNLSDVDRDGPIYVGDVILISNESTVGTEYEFSGTWEHVYSWEYLNSLSEDDLLNEEPAIQMIDIIGEFDPNGLEPLAMKQEFSTAQVGDTRELWAKDYTTEEFYKVTATLQAIGSSCEVWVEDTSVISITDAQIVAEEFDNTINNLVVTNFATPSDVNGDGRIAIFLLDILDGWDGVNNTSATNGCFEPRDLYPSNLLFRSNEMEILYLDTFPLMHNPITNPVDITNAFSCIVHEFQHLVNYNRNVLVEQGERMDTWLNEAFSMAAQHIYEGVQEGRIQYYNKSVSIRDGHSLLHWGDNNGDTLSNYALSYLFGQYLRIQCNIGDGIFKEILQDESDAITAVENAIKNHISSDKAFSEFMTDFRIALYMQKAEGPYGFGNETDLYVSQIFPYYFGDPKDLRGGSSICIMISDSGPLEFIHPDDAGENITFVGMTLFH